MWFVSLNNEKLRVYTTTTHVACFFCKLSTKFEKTSNVLKTTSDVHLLFSQVQLTSQKTWK